MFKILTDNQSVVSEFFLNKTYINNNSVYYEYSNDSSNQTLTLNSYTQISFVDDDKTYVVIDSNNIYIKNSHFLDFAIKLNLKFTDNITSIETNVEVILYEDYYLENNYPSEKLMNFLPKWSTPYKLARSKTQRLYSVYWSIINNTYEISKRFISKKRQNKVLFYRYSKDYFNDILDVSKDGCIKNAYAFYYNSVIPLLLKLEQNKEINFLLKYENIISYCYYNNGYKTDITPYIFYNFIGSTFTEIESLLDNGSNFWILYEDKNGTDINSNNKVATVYICGLDENLKKKEYLVNVSNLNPYLIKENLLWITDVKSSKSVTVVNYLENRICKNSNKNSIGYRDDYIPFSENEEIMYPEININGNIFTINDLYQKSACLKYKVLMNIEQFVIPNKHWIFIKNGINLYYGLLSQHNFYYPKNIVNSSFNNNLFIRNKQIDLGVSSTAEFMIDFYSILEYTKASTYSIKIDTNKESYYLIENISIPKETSKYIKIENIDLDINYLIVTLQLDKSGSLYQAGEILEIISLKKIDTNVSNIYLYNGNHIAIQKTTGKIYEYELIDYLYYQHNQTCYSEYPHELY